MLKVCGMHVVTQALSAVARVSTATGEVTLLLRA